MIYSLAIMLLCLIGGLFALILTKDLIWLLKSFKYFKQGIPVKYFPFIGFAKYLENPEKEEGLEDFYQLFEKAGNKKETEKILMMNGTTTDPVIFVYDKDLVKEFFQKETQVSHTSNLINFPAGHSFGFSDDPQQVQRHRGIFAEMFFPENLRKRTPEIRAIVQRHFNRIKAEIKKTGAQNQDGKLQAEIELKPFIRDIFNDLVSFILFGGEIPEVDGVMLAHKIDIVIDGFYRNYTSPLHIITQGLSTRLGLDSEYNEVKRLFNKISKKLKEVIRERENDKDREFGCNALDLMILKNRELEAQGKREQMMNYDQMADNVFSMIFAGTDTTRSLTESTIYMLSKELDLQKEFRGIIRSQVLDTGNGEDYDKYENSTHLATFMKEALRILGPSALSFQRRVLKTFKLGPYTVSKGDFVIIPFVALQIMPEFFPEGRKFDLKKYEEKKKIRDLSKSILVPFSAGKRNCLGKNLAEISFKLIMSNFLDQFEMERSDEPNRRFIELTIGMKHCKVRISSLE